MLIKFSENYVESILINLLTIRNKLLAIWGETNILQRHKSLAIRSRISVDGKCVPTFKVGNHLKYNFI